MPCRGAMYHWQGLGCDRVGPVLFEVVAALVLASLRFNATEVFVFVFLFLRLFVYFFVELFMLE